MPLCADCQTSFRTHFFFGGHSGSTIRTIRDRPRGQTLDLDDDDGQWTHHQDNFKQTNKQTNKQKKIKLEGSIV